MKKEEKLNQFWKYVLLIVGGISYTCSFVGNGFQFLQDNQGYHESFL